MPPVEEPRKVRLEPGGRRGGADAERRRFEASAAPPSPFEYAIQMPPSGWVVRNKRAHRAGTVFRPVRKSSGVGAVDRRHTARVSSSGGDPVASGRNGGVFSSPKSPVRRRAKLRRGSPTAGPQPRDAIQGRSQPAAGTGAPPRLRPAGGGMERAPRGLTSRPTRRKPLRNGRGGVSRSTKLIAARRMARVGKSVGFTRRTPAPPQNNRSIVCQ